MQKKLQRKPVSNEGTTQETWASIIAFFSQQRIIALRDGRGVRREAHNLEAQVQFLVPRLTEDSPYGLFSFSAICD